MRRFLFWFGWGILIALPFAYAFEIWWIQNLPKVALWQWAILAGAVVLIFLTRNRDDVLRHHVV